MVTRLVAARSSMAATVLPDTVTCGSSESRNAVTRRREISVKIPNRK
jgi:hypothetical protein